MVERNSPTTDEQDRRKKHLRKRLRHRMRQQPLGKVKFEDVLRVCLTQVDKFSESGKNPLQDEDLYRIADDIFAIFAEHEELLANPSAWLEEIRQVLAEHCAAKQISLDEVNDLVSLASERYWEAIANHPRPFTKPGYRRTIINNVVSDYRKKKAKAKENLQALSDLAPDSIAPDIIVENANTPLKEIPDTRQSEPGEALELSEGDLEAGAKIQQMIGELRSRRNDVLATFLQTALTQKIDINSEDGVDRLCEHMNIKRAYARQLKRRIRRFATTGGGGAVVLAFLFGVRALAAKINAHRLLQGAACIFFFVACSDYSPTPSRRSTPETDVRAPLKREDDAKSADPAHEKRGVADKTIVVRPPIWEQEEPEPKKPVGTPPTESPIPPIRPPVWEQAEPKEPEWRSRKGIANPPIRCSLYR